MKINIAYPSAGTQKQIVVTDELKLRAFYDKRISHEVSADSLGPEWKGYIFKITGGADKCGTPMMQGVLTISRVSLLLGKGQTGCKIKRRGVRHRKSVRGCIVDPNLSVLNVVIVKKGSQEIADLTDTTVPRRLGPKRADKIRKIFKLSPEDDVKSYVIHRKVVYKDEAKRKTAEDSKKDLNKAPKIQRLVTLKTKRRTKVLLKEKQKRSLLSKKNADDYHKLLSEIKRKEKKKFEEHRRLRMSSISGYTAAGGKKFSSSSSAIKSGKKVAEKLIITDKSKKLGTEKVVKSKATIGNKTLTVVSSSTKKPITTSSAKKQPTETIASKKQSTSTVPAAKKQSTSVIPDAKKKATVAVPEAKKQPATAAKKQSTTKEVPAAKKPAATKPSVSSSTKPEAKVIKTEKTSKK